MSSCVCFVFFWHRPTYIAIIALTTVATVVLELLVHGGGANTSRHTIQAQAQSWVTHESTNKQTARRHTRHKQTTPDTWMHRGKTDTHYTRHKHNHESHMKAQTNRQQADIQDTRRTTTDTRMHRGIQDTRRQDRHKKTTTDTRIHRDNTRQHKHWVTHDSTNKQTYNTSTSTIMSHTWQHKQADSKQTYKTQEDNNRHQNT